MNAIKTAIVPATSKHTATVVFLHGLGDSGTSWEPVGEMFSYSMPHIKWIFPSAPNRPITLNGGMRMPGWYDILGLSISAPEDEKGLMEMLPQIKQLITNEMNAGIPSERIILGGFSQGAAMSLLSALTLNVKLGGFVVLSGYLPLMQKSKALDTRINKQTPIFMAHGTSDGVVPFEWGVGSHKALQSAGLNVAFNKYSDMGHSTCPAELEDFSKFISKVLN